MKMVTATRLLPLKKNLGTATSLSRNTLGNRRDYRTAHATTGYAKRGHQERKEDPLQPITITAARRQIKTAHRTGQNVLGLSGLSGEMVTETILLNSQRFSHSACTVFLLSLPARQRRP
jgi:hypothetical protein